MANTNIKAGDKVFWFDSWDNLQKGTVAEIITANCVPEGNTPFAKIRQGANGGISTGAELSKCYLDKEACIAAHKAESLNQIEEYAAKITDVQSLVRFMLDQNINDEPGYGNPEARSAAIRRAKELIPGFTYED